MPNHNQAGNPLPSPSEVMNRFGNEVRAPGLLEARFVVSNSDGGGRVGVLGVSVERCFVFVGAAHAQRGDDPFRVVPAFDPGEDRQLGVVPAGPAVPLDQLGFQAS